MQPRIQSLLEALANVVVGFYVSVMANLYVLPMFGYQVTTQDALAIGYVFTVISIIRSYALRRAFNALLRRRS